MLGSVNGVNGATATVNVGIGTTAPKARLDVTGGAILVGGARQGVILKSPDGSVCRPLKVNDSGSLTTNTFTCP